MDTLYATKVFVRIVEAGSLTKAADSFGSTAPKVSGLPQALEYRPGCRLLQLLKANIVVVDGAPHDVVTAHGGKPRIDAQDLQVPIGQKSN